MNEPDTCRKYVVPNLVAAGWDDEPYWIVQFKQIIGRGTRVRDDYGKLWFNILDYTGSATRNSADPAFATREEIDGYGTIKNTEVASPTAPEDKEGELGENFLSTSDAILRACWRTRCRRPDNVSAQRRLCGDVRGEGGDTDGVHSSY